VTVRRPDAEQLDAALSIVPGQYSRAMDAARERARGGAEDAARDVAPAGQPLPAPDAPALTAAQEAYCVARAEGRGENLACQAAGVARQSAWEWRQKPALAAALRARVDALQAEHAAELRRYVRGRARVVAVGLYRLARHAKDEDTRRKASVDFLKLAGQDLDARQPAGPRIVIERAVLTLGDPRADDPGTPQDGG
jgi:hypothetical protein